MKQQLGSRFPKIEQLGCIIPKKRLNSSHVISLFQKDLVRVRGLSLQQDPTGYFSRKARMIEGALKEFKADCDGKMHEVSYGPGRKYVYPGIPVEFAEFVDPAIRDVIDLIAQCRQVMMTGLCCSGHPSAMIRNPNIRDNPSFASINRMNAELGEYVYSHNQSPYLTMLVNSGSIAKDLLGVNVQVQRENAAIQISAKEKGCQILIAGYPRLSIIGRPKLTVFGDSLTHREFVDLYQSALQSFWSRIQEIFEPLVGVRGQQSKAHWFTKADIDWDYEVNLIKSRVDDGLTLANYHYFFGKSSTVAPGFAHSSKTHHL
jgi:hypothetical protein